MKQSIFVTVVSAVLFGLSFQLVSAHLQPVEHGGKTYYVVYTGEPEFDTGAEVCAAAGKEFVGYTNFSNDVCKVLHPSASTKSDMNGSKAGFYCDGPPQGGVCASERDTCHVCPNCNVGIGATEQIGGLYREMYAECKASTVAATTPAEGTETVAPAGPSWWEKLTQVPGRWWGALRSTVARSFDLFREKLRVLTQGMLVKHVTVQVQGPNGTVNAEVPKDSYICEFYQKNKKLVTCGALAAADSFCVTAMNSKEARAVLCQEDGVVVCSNPCTTNPKQVRPKQCAFDGDRARGSQAAPLEFCNETIQIDTKAAATKRAGEVCAHGGECSTGYCLGQPSNSGIKYFCSCKQNVHDTSCNK